MWNWVKSWFVSAEHAVESAVGTAVNDLHKAADRVRGLVAKMHGDADAMISAAASLKAKANEVTQNVKDDAYAVKAKLDNAV